MTREHRVRKKRRIAQKHQHNPSASPDPSDSFITEKVRKLKSFFKSLGLAPQLSGIKFFCSKGDDGDVMFIEIVKKDDDSREEEPEAGGLEIMRRKLDSRENSDRGVSNFTGRIKGMHVFIGNFTFVIDFMIVEDISSIIDPRLSQVVLGKPFVDISNMTHDPPEEVVYLQNEEDNRRGVEYVMSKILGFYKECLELGPEYGTEMDDEGEVTNHALFVYNFVLFAIKGYLSLKAREDFSQTLETASGLTPDGIASPGM
nr:protein kinase-like domain, concanavalin A-like lectin/glucanase domain protein [Tanacetum cinerariifolium]